MNLKNTVLLTGRVVRDIELRGEEGHEVCNVNVAVSRNFKNKETGEYDADFPSVVFFGERAKNVAKYFKKGDPITVQATIRTSTREVEIEGEKKNRTFTDIVGEGFDFPLTRAVEKGEKKSEKAETKTAEFAETKTAEFSEVSEADDDLPF